MHSQKVFKAKVISHLLKMTITKSKAKAVKIIRKKDVEAKIK